MPYAITLSLEAQHVPSVPLDPNDEAFPELCQKHIDDEPGYEPYEGFGAFVLLRIVALVHGLEGIDYVHKPYAVLDRPAMEKAIDSFMRVERFFCDDPASAAVFLGGKLFSKQIAQIMQDPLSDWEETDPDNINFYQMLRCVRSNLADLQSTLDHDRVLAYSLCDSNAEITHAIQNLVPREPEYSRKYLLEIEELLEHGLQAPSLAFVPPARESMTISDTAKWYRHMVTTLEAMTDDATEPFERLQRAWRIKSDLRKAAVIALFDPGLAVEFLDAFPLPELETLLQESGHDVSSPEAAAAALQRLATVSQEETRKFPGTIGESIGLRYNTGAGWVEWNGTAWVPVSDL